MRNYFMIAFTLLIVCCSEETVKMRMTDHNLQADNHVSSTSRIQYPIVIGSEDSFWNEIHSNKTIILEGDAIYEFNRPIVISNLTNLKITTQNGLKAKLRFKFDGSGIRIINNSNYVTIENIELDNVPTCSKCNSHYFSAYDTGRIDVRNSSNVKISKCKLGQLNLTRDLTHKENNQIYVFNSSNCIVDNCTVYPASGELISIIGSNSCTVSNNTVYGGVDDISANSGIETAGSTYAGWYRGYNNRICNNRVYDCVAAFITVNDREAIVENNEIVLRVSRELKEKNIGCGPGIRFGHSESVNLRAVNCTARNNKIRNINGPYGSPSGYFTPNGTVVHASRHDNGGGGVALIENNLIENCTGGISVSDLPGQTVKIKGNTIIALDVAVDIFGTKVEPQNVVLDNNLINSSSDTAAVEYRFAKGKINNNGIYGYNAKGAKIGINVEYSNDLNITLNQIRDSKDYCIRTYKSGGLLIRGNGGTISYSAVIYLDNTDGVQLVNNWLWLLNGNSLYAIYSASSTNLTFTNNTHNYPHYSNY